MIIVILSGLCLLMFYFKQGHFTNQDTWCGFLFDGTFLDLQL